MADTTTPTRWGILGTGKIAGDFAVCIDSMPQEDHQIVAIAARSRDRAEKFAEEFEIPNIHDSYEGVIKDPKVDVVYIATIHINHVELSLACIEAGKNVVCEKPMSLSLDGCRKVLDAAKQKQVLFVEGLWTRFFPAAKFIKEQVGSGALGEVMSVQSNFCVPIWGVNRINDKNLGGSALMDIGCYTAQWVNLIFKGKPESIHAFGTLSEEGVDKSGVIILKYPGNKIATMNFDSRTAPGCNSLYVRGTKANLSIPDRMWCPDRVKMQDGSVKFFQLPAVNKGDLINFDNSQGFCYEIQAVREALLKGKTECPETPHEDSETIMHILTEILKQFGHSFDFL